MFNNSYIKMGKYSRIAHVSFNEPLISELKPEIEYFSKIKKVTEINLTNSCDHYVFVAGKLRHCDYILTHAIQLNFDVAVLWFEGSWPLGTEFEEKLLKAIDTDWADKEWLAAGHILNRHFNDDAPKFHTQCVVINLKTYAKCKDNLWESDLPFPKFKASEENLHDDYTPMYLEPVGGYSSKQLHISNSPFDWLIPLALNNNMYVFNLDYDIRNEKHCCYPEDDIQETKEWLLDTSLTFSDKIDYDLDNSDKQELFGFKVMSDKIVYITNTESVPYDQEYNCEVMVVPCSGLHQFKHMSNAKNTLKQVIWTDFSESGLWWIKKVLNEWDGVDFDKFYKTHRDLFNIDVENLIYDKNLVLDFIASYGDESSWLDAWDWIRCLDHKFMKMDIVKEWQTLVDTIEPKQVVMLQVSNIWQYEINYLNNVHHQAQASFVNLINELLKKSKDVYLTGDSPSGVYYSYQNMKEITSIF